MPIAKSVERRIVVPDVTGSNPVRHPKSLYTGTGVTADELAVEVLSIWTVEAPESGGLQVVSPPGLPPGALPSPEGGIRDKP